MTIVYQNYFILHVTLKKIKSQKQATHKPDYVKKKKKLKL